MCMIVLLTIFKHVCLTPTAPEDYAVRFALKILSLLVKSSTIDE